MPFADLELARLLEGIDAWCGSQFVRAHREIRPEADARATPVGGGTALVLGPGSPINEAKGLGMSGPVALHELEAMGREFHDRGLPARVIACPLADPSLLDGLARLGYRPAGFENVLYRPLDPAESFPSPPPAIEVTRAASGEEAEIWGEVLARGFAAPEEPGPELREVAAMNARIEAVHELLARYHGEPAGAAGLLIHDDMAMLCGASTLPAFRNRGVQTALAHARLALAACLGCRIATMGAEPGTSSQRNAERLGFRIAYTRLVLSLDPP